MKNPPCQSAWRVSENLSGKLYSSLAVFYVEQVALNRHVSPQPQLLFLCLKSGKKSREKPVATDGARGASNTTGDAADTVPWYSTFSSAA